MSSLRFVCAALFSLVVSPLAIAQSYTSILVFGDSLSDTGNFAHVTKGQYLVRIPGPVADYTDGRFTDGTDTKPSAVNYNGIWIEQLAATFPAKPAILNSLDGGTNYAYGFASTGSGTSMYSFTPPTTVTLPVGLPTSISILIDNIGMQVTNYLTANHTIPANTLVVVWGGANDLLTSSSTAAINTAVTGELTAIQQLVAAGARDILVPNVPPLGAIPRLNTNSTLSQVATAATVAFNSGLKTGLTNLQTTNATAGITLNLFQLDVFSLVSAAIATPSIDGLVNVTASSQNVSGINPDTYLFWDDLHPTTAGHHAIALAAAALFAPAVATTTTLTSSALTANTGATVTFTANVSAAAGSPTGTVTFLDGGTSIGTGTVTVSGSTVTPATFSTTTLAAGTHTITASYGGGTGFLGSTSSAITETIVAPSVTAALSTSTITVAAGASGTSTLTVTPVGGYTGSVSFACGTVPLLTSCAIVPTSLAFTASSVAQTATVTLSTGGTTSSAAFLLFPLGGFGVLLALRRKGLNPALLVLLLMLSGVSLVSFTGCGSKSGSSFAAKGTYPVVITVTPSTGAPSTLNLSLIVQ